MESIISFFSRREYLRTSLLLTALVCAFFWPHVSRGVNILMSSRMEHDPMYEIADKEVRTFQWPDATPPAENYPFTWLARSEIRKGLAPLWNPYNAMGAPLLANFQTAPFFPLKMLLYLTDMRKTYTYYLISRLFLAGLLTYLFARRLGLSQWGATYASLAFAFCGYNVVTLQYHIEPIVLMPGLFYVAHRLASKPRIREVLFAGLAYGIVCLSGHPELAFIAVLGSTIYFLALSARVRKSFTGLLKNTGLLSIAGLICLGISMVVVLPFLEFLRFGFTYKFVPHTYMIDWKSFWGSGAKGLSNLLIPHYVSPWVGFASSGYTHMPFQYEYYCGVLTLPLAAYAVLKKQAERPLGLVLIIGSIMAFNLPPFTFLNELPLLKHLYPYYNIPLVAFPLAVIGGRGLDALRVSRNDDGSALEQICLVVGLCALAVVAYFGHSPTAQTEHTVEVAWLCATILLLVVTFSGRKVSAPRKSEEKTPHMIKLAYWIIGIASLLFMTYSSHPPIREAIRWENLTRLSVTVLLLGLFCGVRRLYSRYDMGGGVYFSASVLFLLAFDLFNNGTWIYAPQKNPCDFSESPALSFLKQDKSLFRVLGTEGVFLPNNGALHDVQQSEIAEVVYVRRYRDLLRPGSSAGEFFEVYPDWQDPVLDAMNVKYLLCKKDHTLDLPGKFRLAYEDDFVEIYRNQRVFPRAYVVNRAVLADDPLQAVGFAKADPQGLRERVILESNGDDALGETIVNINAQSEPRALHAAKVISYEPREVVIEARSNGPGVLVVSDTYYPGWKAYVDDVETRIYPANCLGRAVLLSPGKHVVKFTYSPESFRIGAAVAGFSLGGSFLGLVLLSWRDRRKR